MSHGHRVSIESEVDILQLVLLSKVILPQQDYHQDSVQRSIDWLVQGLKITNRKSDTSFSKIYTAVSSMLNQCLLKSLELTNGKSWHQF